MSIAEHLVEVVDLHKSYGAVRAVSGVSMTVRRGEIHGVLGPNGAGKTTTVETIAGLRTPDSGTVRVAGVDPAADRARATRLIGVQLQEAQLQPKLHVGEALRLWSALYPDPVPWPELASRLGLSELLGRRFDTLSGGQRQRLSIALALVGRPSLVVLDELTTGLDPQARRETWELVRETRAGGTTVVLVTHSMEEAQHLCDRVTVIAAGRDRAQGTPTELTGRADVATVTSFVPSGPVPLADLAALPGVTSARTQDDRVVVLGAEDLALDLLGWLDGRGVVPRRLRVTEGSLDDAYLDLVRDTPELTEETHR